MLTFALACIEGVCPPVSTSALGLHRLSPHLSTLHTLPADMAAGLAPLLAEAGVPAEEARLLLGPGLTNLGEREGGGKA